MTIPLPAITLLAQEELSAATADLARLLADAIEDGASIGFLATTDQKALTAWWETVAAAHADGFLRVWAARDETGTLVGTVQLRMASLPNGVHRAEIAKLVVHRRARGRGLGRELLSVAEEYAAGAGISLLHLDTETGSGAEHLYTSAGWTRSGTIPDYAVTPTGTLHPTTIFYKQLDLGDGLVDVR